MNSDTPYQSPKENLKMIRVLFGALVAGVFLFLLMAIFINRVNGPLTTELREFSKYLPGLALSLSLICLFIAVLAYKKGVVEARNLTAPLNEKLNQYRSFLIKYLAFCEGPALFCIVVFIMTGDARILTIAAVLLVAMLAITPSKKRVVNDLNLDWKEQQELD
ncbi:MAG TPA: hypothetical protein VFX58_06300 [Chitinophagaceae bacterium]|nr:hypothetical protein [Chitinophagaceae bacterium]